MRSGSSKSCVRCRKGAFTADEMNWTGLEFANCSQSTSWRWRAWPIARRVTGSTWCRSVRRLAVWRLSLRIHVFRTGLQFSSVPPLWILPKSGVSNTKTTDLKINIAELHILRWSELSRRKLSPTLATAHHYSCPDNAIGLVAQCDLSEYVKLG